jgi:hypothetical protein
LARKAGSIPVAIDGTKLQVDIMSHVNVAMRVRPVEGNSGDYLTVVPPGTMLLKKPDGEDMYQFSYTFAAQQITNEEIFNEVGKPVVESVLDGYNGTVLAYGQTGSGMPRAAV